MKNEERFIDAYEIYYKDMLNTNINASHRAKDKKNDKNVVKKNTFENKKDHF